MGPICLISRRQFLEYLSPLARGTQGIDNDSAWFLLDAGCRWKGKGEGLLLVRPDDPYSGQAEMADTEGAFQVDQVSLDDEVESKPLIGPFLIKLDTHGADLDILAGANRTLKETKLIVAEVYNFQSSEKRFPQFCIHLEELGFRCVDIAAPLFRPRDGAFYQFPECTITPRPLQLPHPPIYVACFSEPTLRRAARGGFNVIFAPFAAAMMFGSFGEAVQTYKELAADAGHGDARSAGCVVSRA